VEIYLSTLALQHHKAIENAKAAQKPTATIVMGALF
jgi:hypothetical protein